MTAMPLKHKYLTRKVVKNVSRKSDGTVIRRKSALAPKIKQECAHTPVMMVMDGGTGKTRWVRG